jgi:hypothetical protein
MDNFTIVLFKNKVKKRIIKKFKTKARATKFYKDLIDENKKVFFGVETENGKQCKYEIALVSRMTDSNPYFVRDEYGRTIKIEMEDPDFMILEINSYNKEEMLFDIKNSKRISIPEFLRKYLPKVGVKLLSKINNKIVVQRDSDINLFSLKSEDDCDRFVDGISNYMMDGGRIDTIIVKDSSQHQKKYLYDLLDSNGIPKSILYRRFTTYRRE